MEFDMSLPASGPSGMALRHEPSPPKRLRLSEGITNDDNAVPEWDCSAPYEQWLDYSAYERPYKSPSPHSSHQDNEAESNAHTIQAHDCDDDQALELRQSTATMPAFFHSAKYN